MNINSLRYFVAIADCGSFTKAAELLYVTQPTLSKQIAALEEELGEELLIRKRKSIELTVAGEICLEQARKIVAQCDKLYAEIRHSGGELSITYCQGMHVVPKLLGVFTNEYPDITLDLACIEPGKQITLLNEGRVDFIFTLDTLIQDLSNVSRIGIMPAEIRLAVPSADPLAQRRFISIEELKNEKFIMAERSFGPEGVDLTVDLCMKNGFRPAVSYYVRDIHSALYLVSIGKGVALLSNYTANLRIPGIKYLRLKGDGIPPMELSVAYKTTNSNPAVPLLIKVLKKNIK